MDDTQLLEKLNEDHITDKLKEVHNDINKQIHEMDPFQTDDISDLPKEIQNSLNKANRNRHSILPICIMAGGKDITPALIQAAYFRINRHLLGMSTIRKQLTDLVRDNQLVRVKGKKGIYRNVRQNEN